MTTTAHEDQFTDAPEPIREPLSRESILRRNVADLELALRTQTERAESYAETLRSLASYVGAGGYNADTVDAGVFEEKIRWGIGEIMTRAEAAEAELAKAREQKPTRWYVRGNYFHDGDAAILFASMNAVHGAKVEQLYAAPVPAPAVPYGIDEEAANRIALAVYDCKNGIKSEPLLHAINHILMKEIHPLSKEGLAQMQPTHQPVGNPDTLTPHEVFEQAMAQPACSTTRLHAATPQQSPGPDCRTCANRGRVNGLSQETYCDGCVWYGAYWKKNHYKPLPEPAP